MVNFESVIKRIEALKGIKGDKHVAVILGISPPDFSNRKKRGSLLPVIFEWAINENVNLDWLIKGDSSLNCDTQLTRIIGLWPDIPPDHRTTLVSVAEGFKNRI